MPKVLDCDLRVSEFKLQSHYYVYFQINTFVWRQIDKNPRTGLYFRTCEDGAGWHLIPYRNKSCSEFFSQADKNWHITWGNNLRPDWPPLARGSKISHYHTPTRSLSSFPEIMEESEPIGLSCNNINIATVIVGNSGFPCDTLGIKRTVLSKIM